MRRVGHMLLRLVLDRRGAAAIVGALTAVSIIGMGGLAIDLGSAYAQKARLQKVADSAAMAGALSWIKTSHSTTAVTATVTSVVQANGLASSVIDTTNTG